MERTSWGIQQRLDERPIHPRANIGGHMWTSDLRLRVRHFSTKMSMSLFEVLRGIPPRVGYAGRRGSNDLWRKLSEQNEARALDQAQMEVLTRGRRRLEGGTRARERWHWKHSVDLNHRVLNFWAKVTQGKNLKKNGTAPDWLSNSCGFPEWGPYATQGCYAFLLIDKAAIHPCQTMWYLEFSALS